jgi:hypothetical protein
MSALAIIMGIIVFIILFGGVVYGIMRMEKEKS